MSTKRYHHSEKTMTYSCKVQIPSCEDGFVRCKRFPSGIHDNCSISIWLESILTATKLRPGREGTDPLDNIVSVAIEKTDETPTKVQMNVQIREIEGACLTEKTESFDNWQSDFCYFRRLSFISPSVDAKFEIVVKITWTVFESSTSYFDISQFLMNESLSDVTIVIGDEELLAHKLVLGAASPVMLSMLTSPIKQERKNCIVIEDVEIDVMKAVLKLLYTGKDEQFNEIEMALKALAVAQKYEMTSLQELCEQKLLKQLTIDNAVTVLDVADTCQAETLVKESLKFIVEHKKEIIHSEACKELYLRKPLLMMQFTMSVIDDK